MSCLFPEITWLTCWKRVLPLLLILVLTGRGSHVYNETDLLFLLFFLLYSVDVKISQGVMYVEGNILYYVLCCWASVFPLAPYPLLLAGWGRCAFRLQLQQLGTELFFSASRNCLCMWGPRTSSVEILLNAGYTWHKDFTAGLSVLCVMWTITAIFGTHPETWNSLQKVKNIHLIIRLILPVYFLYIIFNNALILIGKL